MSIPFNISFINIFAWILLPLKFLIKPRTFTSQYFSINEGNVVISKDSEYTGNLFIITP